MSSICFPIKKEHIPTVIKNIRIATDHPSVSLVLIAATYKNACYDGIVCQIDKINASSNPFKSAVAVIIQSRLGSLRSGKGDGTNSAMQYFLNEHKEHDLPAPIRRLHSYDADIESFDALWVSKAEDGSALGYDIVRHYFPRSSTDAQVTWQVTKVGFALLWPQTSLPWVQQPLGAELCFSRKWLRPFRMILEFSGRATGALIRFTHSLERREVFRCWRYTSHKERYMFCMTGFKI